MTEARDQGIEQTARYQATEAGREPGLPNQQAAAGNWPMDKEVTGKMTKPQTWILVKSIISHVQQ